MFQFVMVVCGVWLPRMASSPSALVRDVTTICSPSNTPLLRQLVESGSCYRIAAMAWTSTALGAPCTTILRTARRALLPPAAALACAWSLLLAHPCWQWVSGIA